ncbi:rhamnosyltransferase WsaF family glycosyltransferase [Flexivirga lutea]
MARTKVIISLQATPHPSHPPLDMVASGGHAVNERGRGKSVEPASEAACRGAGPGSTGPGGAGDLDGVDSAGRSGGTRIPAGPAGCAVRRGRCRGVRRRRVTARRHQGGCSVDIAHRTANAQVSCRAAASPASRRAAPARR